MIDLENRVVQHFVAQHTTVEWVPEDTAQDEDLPAIKMRIVYTYAEALEQESHTMPDFVLMRSVADRKQAAEDEPLLDIRRKDILALNKTFTEGHIPDYMPYAPYLAAFNCQRATEVCRSKTDKRKCAMTLLQLLMTWPGPPALEPTVIWDALALFEPREIGRLGYHACMMTGNHMSAVAFSGVDADPAPAYKEAARLYARASLLGEHITDIGEGERRRLRAKAMLEAARVFSMLAMSDPRAARTRALDALKILDEDGTEESLDSMLLHSHILALLLRAVTELRDRDAQFTYHEKAIDSYRNLLARPDLEHEQRAEALSSLAGLHAEDQQYDEAICALEKSLGLLSSLETSPLLPQFETVAALNQLIQVLQMAGREKDAKRLLEQVLQERGVAVAAQLGHENALTVERVANIFLPNKWIAEYAESKKLPKGLSRQDTRLLFMLNADGPLVQQIEGECRSLADISGPEMHWYHRGHEYWTLLAGFYRCVLALQRMAERISKGEYRGRESDSWAQYLAFPDFALGDVELLEAVVRRGAAYRRQIITAGLSGADEPWYQGIDIDDLEDIALPGETRVQLCVCTPDKPMSSQGTPHYGWGGEAVIRDDFIWEAFTELVEAVRDAAQEIAPPHTSPLSTTPPEDPNSRAWLSTIASQALQLRIRLSFRPWLQRPWD